MKLNLVWKKKTGQYQLGSNLYLNAIRVASYDWNISRDTKWAGMILLPSLKDNERFANEEDEIKSAIELDVNLWFKEALKPAIEKKEEK